MQALTGLISYAMLAITPALAQATTPPATGGDIPWVWIILAIIVIGGGIWWYMKRSRMLLRP
jgi:LPXTG-motif cell wall-anchored protein